MMLEVVPVTLKAAKAFIAQHHRHNLPPQGWKFGVGLMQSEVLVGVGVAGRPVARRLDDGRTIEITRVCVSQAPNGCSKLYGALRKASMALGYRRVITYTLAAEPGASLKAAGFRVDAHLPQRPTWDTPSRPREQTDATGLERRPTEAKVRWIWEVSR